MEDILIKETIKDISESLKRNGYDPVNQIVGYLISNDLGYIPDFEENRNKITKLDRTLILESMLNEYLK